MKLRFTTSNKYLLGVVLSLVGCSSSQAVPAASPDASAISSSGGSANGGASGAGGSAPAAGGSPQHVVSACPTDGAEAGSNGKWEEVTPPGVQLSTLNGKTIYGTQAVLINPFDTSNVIVGLDQQGLFKSTDCASTWTKINTGRNGSTLDTGAQWSMAMSPKHPNIIYAVNGYGSEIGLWKSTNGGVDWDQLFPEGSEVQKTVQYNFVSIVSIDAADENHLVVSFHAPCQGAYAPSCQAESKDAGANWRLMKSPPIDNFEGAGPMVLNATSWIYAAPANGMWLTTDNGESWKDVTPSGASGSHYQLYHSPKGEYFVGTGWGVVKSSDGLTWSLIPNSGARLTGIVGNGKHIWASQQYGGEYYTASEDSPDSWSQLPTPGKPSPADNGGYLLAYDNDHHLLYSTNQAGGLWRVAIE